MKVLAGIRRHALDGLMAAMRTSQDALQNRFAMHRYHLERIVLEIMKGDTGRADDMRLVALAP